MPDPYVFPGATPSLGLPLLVPGQAQKEFFVNEALFLVDALHARAVTASQSAPPAIADDGACFRVTPTASGAWAGQEERLAVRVAGAWHFIAPSEGMVVFDRSASSWAIFRSQWHPAVAIAAPAGGTVIDAQARAALGDLISALKTLGVLA